MAKKSRFGRLTAGSQYNGMVTLAWDDANEFNRDQADDEFSGDPIEVSRKGSGSIESTECALPPSGHQTNEWVFLYEEVELVAGVEAAVEKTETFTKVTCNHGGNLNAGNIGKFSAKFDYATRTHA